jgi:hypothetical protein
MYVCVSGCLACKQALLKENVRLSETVTACSQQQPLQQKQAVLVSDLQSRVADLEAENRRLMTKLATVGLTLKLSSSRRPSLQCLPSSLPRSLSLAHSLTHSLTPSPHLC